MTRYSAVVEYAWTGRARGESAYCCNTSNVVVSSFGDIEPHIKGLEAALLKMNNHYVRGSFRVETVKFTPLPRPAQDRFDDPYIDGVDGELG